MTIVAMIPARRGSKGLPDKNALQLAGKPMIAHTIEAAKEAGLTTVVNTDCPQCRHEAWKHGVGQYGRPPELATDDASMLDVVKDFVRHGVSPDCTGLAVLYPTYPLRTAQDIRGAVDRFAEYDRAPLVGITEPKSHPYMCVRPNSNGWPESFVPVDRDAVYRRQDHPKVYELTHAVCMLPVPLPPDLNAQLISARTVSVWVPGPVIDIDSRYDFDHAEAILRYRKRDALSRSVRELIALEEGWE